MSMKLPSETCSLVGILDPDAYSTSAFTTGTASVIDMSNFRSLMVTAAVGDWTTAGTFDLMVTECATSNGTFTSIAGKSITQMGEVATSANHQAIINVDAIEMGTGMRWIGLNAAIVAGIEACVMVHGFSPRYTDAVISTAYGDLATVDEIVT